MHSFSGYLVYFWQMNKYLMREKKESPSFVTYSHQLRLVFWYNCFCFLLESEQQYFYYILIFPFLLVMKITEFSKYSFLRESYVCVNYTLSVRLMRHNMSCFIIYTNQITPNKTYNAPVNHNVSLQEKWNI